MYFLKPNTRLSKLSIFYGSVFGHMLTRHCRINYHSIAQASFCHKTKKFTFIAIRY